MTEYERQEAVCTEAALSQWARSKSRPDMDEEARVRGAIEAYKRQAFAFAHLPSCAATDESGQTAGFDIASPDDLQAALEARSQSWAHGEAALDRKPVDPARQTHIDAEAIQRVRDHVEANAAKERATFSIAGIKALLFALDEPHPAPSTHVTGIELAARFVEKRLNDYVQDHGYTDPDTGTVEFPGNGDEYVGELEEIIEGIRSLAATEGQS